MNGDLRVLIADDDSGMRMILRRLIEKANGFTLAGEASDGKQAIELAETLRPDVVFLDVEMPEMTGVECARVIQDMNPAILLIFATAHEGYMGDAFEVYAFDYLVKPFKVERVMQTLERARNLLRSPETAPEPARPPLSRPRVEGRMMLHHRGGVSFLSFEDIVLIQREERSTVLYTADALLRRRAGFSLREASAAAQVAHSRTPMLFIHGGKDAFVPFAMLDEVYAAARCPKEKYVEPDAGHAESLRMAPARYWAKVFGFIGRWMPLPGAERTVAADPAEKPV